MKEPDNHQDLESALWTASCQLRALGELLAFQKRQPAADEEDICYGYGSLIRDIGENLAKWSRLQEAKALKQED